MPPLSSTLAAAGASVRGDPVLRGILCMLLGTMLLTTQDAISKWLTSGYHVGEITVYRGIFTLPVILWLAQREGGIATLRSRRPRLTAWRALMAFGCSICVVEAFSRMPLADALAVIFVSPLLLTALSPLMLREPVGWRRWAAVLVGFGGVLMMTRPGAEGFAWWIVFPLAAATLAALRDIATRQLGGADSATSVLFWTMALSIVLGAVTLPFGTSWPSAFDWMLFAAGGVLLAVSHWLTITAFHLASAAIVAPFKYLSLVWAAGLGFIVWGDVPDAIKIAGAALVVAAGLYIWQREMKRKKV